MAGISKIENPMSQKVNELEFPVPASGMILRGVTRA